MGTPATCLVDHMGVHALLGVVHPRRRRLAHGVPRDGSRCL
jgi:hypothetical protein